MEDKPTLQANWRELELSQIGSILTGKTPSTKNSGNFGDGTPFITPSDIADQRYIVHTSRCITEQGLKEVKSLRVPPETIIVPCIGYIGKVSISGQESVTNQQINSIIPNPEFNSLYIYYSLKSIMEGIGYSISGGSVVPIINKTTFSKLTIRVPSRHHQDVIANILGSLDDKIELNRQINEKLEGIAQALFKSWFIDFDPVRAKVEGRDTGLPEHISSLFPASFVNSELEQIPDGWKFSKLGVLCVPTIGGVWGEEKPDISLERAICLRGCDMEYLRDSGYSSEAPIRYLRESAISSRSLEDTDVLVAASGAGPCGRSLWASEEIKALYDEPLVYSNFVKRIRCNNKNTAIYIDALLHTMLLTGEIYDYINGTSVPNLDLSGLLKGKQVVIPDSRLLDIFTEFEVTRYRKLFSKENLVLSNLRDTLLPKLISGELPIPDAERIVGRYL